MVNTQEINFSCDTKREGFKKWNSCYIHQKNEPFIGAIEQKERMKLLSKAKRGQTIKMNSICSINNGTMSVITQ